MSTRKPTLSDEIFNHDIPVLKRTHRLDVVTQKLVDSTKIDSNLQYNNICIYKHQLPEDVDLSLLEPFSSESENSFGGSLKKTYYSITMASLDTNIKQVRDVTKQICDEFAELLPGYKYYVVTNKVEIFNKDRSKLNQLSCKLAINHSKQTIYNNLILA